MLATIASLVPHLGRNATSQPVHPLRLAAVGSWPAPAGDLHLGDVRALVEVDAAAAAAAAPVSVQIWWRRRDANPEVKSVVVHDAAGQPVAQPTAAQISASCGTVTFTPDGATEYRIYYLPYHQSGGGANLHFHWEGCASHERECVLGAGAAPAAEPDACAAVGNNTAASVVALEGRPTSAAVERPGFHMLTPMELVATKEELVALAATPPAASGPPPPRCESSPSRGKTR
jgi:hypothetical protein